MPETKIIKFHNCYDDGWQGIIVPEAFSHPAKMAYGLLKRILSHAKAEGWLSEGDVIIDPFGGIGSTGILGAYEGYQVVCVELEAKFVKLAEQNFELHKDAWVEFGNPFPVILQGDSRKLCEVVQKADCIVSSPPYMGSEIAKGDAKQADIQDRKERRNKKEWHGYGQTPGQLGAMKSGKVDMVLSSPPWADQEGSMQSKKFKEGSAKMLSDRNAEGKTKGHYATPAARKRAMDKADKQEYGHSEGQLGNLKSGDLIISSPPYEGSMTGSNVNPDDVVERKTKHSKSGGTWKTPGRKRAYVAMMSGYNPDNKNNLGSQKGETFWSAAKLIVDQCFQILKPGGHAIWVVKSFVRKKKIVDFPGDWQRLCESVGFKTVCVHQAMLVKETKHQTLFGHTEVKRKERKSFFRRLAESKGSPRIDYEVVLCMQKD